jgi:tetratricopeptide (TPR) repeat protein
MDMDVLDHDRLAVPFPAPIEGLEQVALKLEEPVGITSIDRDVLFAQVALAQLHHAERGEASDDELHAHQSFNLAFMIGDSESEIEMADRAVALNPNSHIAWQNRGWVYKIAGLQEEAIRRFERAIRMSPVDPLLHPAFIGIGIFNHLIRL